MDKGETVKTMPFTYWQDSDMWIGFLEEYPDYKTQGESLADLKERLVSLLEDL
jgi:hypothetical protein